MPLNFDMIIEKHLEPTLDIMMFMLKCVASCKDRTKPAFHTINIK